MDLLFGLLQHLLTVRFSEGCSSTVSDFIFDAWSDRAREALCRTPEKTAEMLKSIFSSMPGVEITHPSKERK
jgi:GTP cyclohydrolase I